MKKLNRTLSMLLVLAVVLSCLPGLSLAEEAVPVGAAEEVPFIEAVEPAAEPVQAVAEEAVPDVPVIEEAVQAVAEEAVPEVAVPEEVSAELPVNPVEDTVVIPLDEDAAEPAPVDLSEQGIDGEVQQGVSAPEGETPEEGDIPVESEQGVAESEQGEAEVPEAAEAVEQQEEAVHLNEIIPAIYVKDSRTGASFRLENVYNGYSVIGNIVVFHLAGSGSGFVSYIPAELDGVSLDAGWRRTGGDLQAYDSAVLCLRYGEDGMLHRYPDAVDTSNPYENFISFVVTDQGGDRDIYSLAVPACEAAGHTWDENGDVCSVCGFENAVETVAEEDSEQPESDEEQPEAEEAETEEKELLEASEVQAFDAGEASALTDEELEVLYTELQNNFRMEQEYLALSMTDDPVQLILQGIPEQLLSEASVDWVITDSENTVISDGAVAVDATGVVSVSHEGSAFVVATVSVGERAYSARCRVDVVEEVAAAVTGASLLTQKATVELYKTDYARIPVLLELPQNRDYSAFSVGAESTYDYGNNGVAIEYAEFVEEAVNELFALRVADDRTLEIVPRDNAVADPPSVKSSYKSAVVVSGNGWRATTGAVSLTIKKTQPKVTAKAVKFNSFIEEASQPLVFTGGSVRPIEVTSAPDWVVLNGDSLQLTPSAKNQKLSGKVNLLVNVDGWLDTLPVSVSVSVTASKTAPKLTVKPASLTLNPDTGDSASADISVSMAEYEDAAIDVSHVMLGKTPADDALTCSFSGHTITVQPKPGYNFSKACSFTVYLSIAGEKQAGKLTVKTLVSQKAVPSMTLKAAGTIDTAIPGSFVTLTVTPKNYSAVPDYSVSFTRTDSKTKTTESADDLFLWEQKGHTILLTKNPDKDFVAGNYTYNAVVSAEVGDHAISGTAKMTIKSSDPAKTARSVTLKAKGAIDVIRPQTSVTVTPTFKNWYGHDLVPADLVFFRGAGKAAEKLSEGESPFVVELSEDGSSYIVSLKENAAVNTKKEKYSVGMRDGSTSDPTLFTKSPLALTVKMGTAKFTQSVKTVELAKNDRYSSSEIRISTADDTLSAIETVELVENKTSAPFAWTKISDGVYSVHFKDDTVPSVKSASLKLAVTLKGNNTGSPNASLTLSVKLVDTKPEGEVEKFPVSRKLSVEVFPEGAGSVIFQNSRGEEITEQVDGEAVIIVPKPSEGYMTDRVLYREGNETEWKGLSSPYRVVVTGKNLFFRVEYQDEASYPPSDLSDFTFEAIDDNTCRIVQYTGNDTAVRVPSENAEGLSVTEIGDAAFESKDIVTILIPESVKIIGVHAFYGCTALTRVRLPEGLRIIDPYAFALCYSLNDIHIPDSVESFAGYAFEDCYNLETVNFPLNWKGNRVNSASPFVNCNALKKVTIPEGVTLVPGYAFAWVNSIKEVSLPDSLENIEDFAFAGTGITEITVPEKVKLIPVGAFSGCEALTNVELPKDLKTIETSAFANCISLESIHIPDSVEILAGNAFEDCDKLKTVNYPLNWNDLGSASVSPFNNCDAFRSITIPDGVIAIPDHAFENCTALIEVSPLPASVTQIGSYAFCGCTSLPSVSMSNNVSTIGQAAFKNCTSLSSLNVF